MSNPSESSADVQREVETERAGLVNTLDQLRENLKPANVVDEVMTSAKLTTTEIGDRVWLLARDHPIPAVLIGIGALMMVGAGTQARKFISPGDRDGHDDNASAGTVSVGGGRTPVGTWSASEFGDIPPRGKTGGQDRKAKSTAAAAVAKIAESADSLRNQAAGKASALRRNISDLSGKSSMSQYPRSRNQVGSSLTRLIDEQPLVIAALGVAVGAAIGAAIPRTDAESRLMGDASAGLKSRAQQLAASEFEHLKETAGATLDDLKKTAADRGVSTDNLQGLVQDATTRVRDAAHDVADHAAGSAAAKP